MKKLALIVAVALAAGLAQAAEYPDISVADLKAAIESGKVAVLDANGTASWKEGRVPGAIDFAASKAKLAELLPKEKDVLVVAYCGGPKCGAYKAAAEAAQKLGYTNVKHLSAGISGWKAAGEKVEKSE
jgi:rhodanese-related sulfurtransferase